MKQGKFYIIKCESDREHFIKAGITGCSLSRRFSGKKMPYKWSVLLEVDVCLIDGIKIESALCGLIPRYSPLLKFGGYLECYQIEHAETAIEFVANTVRGVRNEVD